MRENFKKKPLPTKPRPPEEPKGMRPRSELQERLEAGAEVQAELHKTSKVEQDLKALAVIICEALDYISTQKDSMKFDEQGKLISRIVDGNLSRIKDKIEAKFNIKVNPIMKRGG